VSANDRWNIKTPEGIDWLKKRVAHLCGTKYIYENPDDIFQELYTRFLNKPESKQTIEHCLIDYLRQRDGRVDKKIHCKGLIYRAEDIDEYHHIEDDHDKYEAVEAKIDTDWRLKILKPRDRLIIQKYYFDSMTELEIGKQLNLSDQRVHQIRVSALEQMRYARKETLMEQQPEVQKETPNLDPYADYLSGGIFCKNNRIDYLKFSYHSSKGEIPHVFITKPNGVNARHVSPEVMTKLLELKEAHGPKEMWKHLPWDIDPALITKKTPDTLHKEKDVTQASNTAICEIKKKLIQRANELKRKDRFEAACELYAIAAEF
jgi:RNA polymerase sigma factor (sigma-70 family)